MAGNSSLSRYYEGQQERATRLMGLFRRYGRAKCRGNGGGMILRIINHVAVPSAVDIDENFKLMKVPLR